MSLSLIACQPRMLEPSKPRPSSKTSSSSLPTGMVKCCQSPGKSMNRRSTALTSFSRHNARTSRGVIRLGAPGQRRRLLRQRQAYQSLSIRPAPPPSQHALMSKPGSSPSGLHPQATPKAESGPGPGRRGNGTGPRAAKRIHAQAGRVLGPQSEYTPQAGRVGPGDFSPGPLTEPDLWATHPALWVGISQVEQQAFDQRPASGAGSVAPTWSTSDTRRS